MVDLPGPSRAATPIVTSEAPQSRLSGAEVAQPYQELSRAFSKTSQALEELAIPVARRAAAEDLQNQKVTRNADGSVNVENPASAPFIFGEAGQAYHAAVATGTVAQWHNVLSQSFAEMHQDHPADPTAFKNASDAYIAKIGSDIQPTIREAILREGAQLQTQHFNAITDKAASIDVESQKQSIIAQIDDQKNTLIGLARKDGSNTPEWGQAVGRLNRSYDQLTTNPLFKMSQDQVNLEKKNTTALLQGEALVAQVDATFKKKDGKFLAQQELERDILNNPDMREIDRTRLYSQGMARLQFLSAGAKATADANHAIVTEMEKGFADGKVNAEDPAVGMAIQHAMAIGDYEGVMRITAAAQVQQHLRGLQTLPSNVRSDAFGLPNGGGEPVNTAIPPEGRALLKQIGSTESANRYDVGYGGNRFFNYADHPGVHVPITSGPDVGKTTSAAGYYQFEKATWDQQKQKLGLTDFSPANQDAAAWDLAQTEYKAKTGKDLLTTLRSGNTADVLPSLSGQWSSLPGGRQPARAMVPSVNGGPGFTAEDVQRNPFLLSAYVRSLAADPDTRVQSAKQTAAAIGKAIDNGLAPSPESVAEVRQAGALFPDKMGPTVDEMEGRFIGLKLAGLPQAEHDQLLAAYRDATNGQDVHQIRVAAAALAQDERQQKNMIEHPLIEAANRGWTQPPLPIDPAKPDSIAPTLAQHAILSEKIGRLNGTPNPPLIDKDDMPKLQSVLQGKDGAQTLAAIGQSLKPDEMQTLLNEEGFRKSVTGMSRSGDFGKMNAAYSFMDTLQRQNPLQFDRQFESGLRDLRTWQGNLGFYPPEEAVKRMMQTFDPAKTAGREAADKVANKALEAVSPVNIVSKFSTGFGPIGTGARLPVTEEAGAAAGALKADYDKNYRDAFIDSGDASTADKFAMEKLKLKYDLSPTNGNRVMAYPPERYYPQVGGSHDWLKEQLDSEVAKSLGITPRPGMTAQDILSLESTGGTLPAQYNAPAERKYAAPRGIVSDDTTERDIANGKPPSYQVILQDQDGRWSVMSANGAPLRMRFDPAAPFAERAATMERIKPTMQELAKPPEFGGVTP